METVSSNIATTPAGTAPENNAHFYLLIASGLILLPFLLFHFRAFDDNRLTSWQWTFAGLNMAWFPVRLGAGLAAAFLLSRLRLARRRPLLLLGSSFLAGAMFWGEPEVIVDASRYFTQAKQLAANGPGYFFAQWGKEIFAWTDLPLMPFCYGLVFKYFGESRIAIQILTTLIFSATVLLTHGLGRLLWDEETGFHGALLLLGIPYLYTQIPLLLVDVPTMFFLLLALYLFILALRRGGNIRVLLAGLAIFGAFYVKFSTWVFLAGFGMVFLLHLSAAPLATCKRGGAVALWAALFIGLLFYLEQDLLLAQIRFLLDYQKAGLDRWGESHVSTFLFQIHPLISGAAAYSLIEALRKRDLVHGNIAVFVLLIFVLDLQRIRYILPLFPFITLLAARGMNAVNDRGARRFLVFGVVHSSLIIALTAYLPFLENMSAVNIREAGEFLNSRGIEAVEVIPLARPGAVVNPEVAIPLLDYFTTARIGYEEVPARPELAAYRQSALRFTWEYRPPDDIYRPPLYRPPLASTSGRQPLVVLSSRPVPELPPALLRKSALFRHSRTFSRATGVFLDQTVVSVYYD